MTTGTINAPPDRLLRADEVAALLGVSEHGVKRLHRTHALRGHILLHKLRFSQCDVEEFIYKLGERQR